MEKNMTAVLYRDIPIRYQGGLKNFLEGPLIYKVWAEEEDMDDKLPLHSVDIPKTLDAYNIKFIKNSFCEYVVEE
jgi:hypothetical protein